MLLVWLVAYFRYKPAHLSLEGNGKYEGTLARGDGYYQYLNMLSLLYDRDLDLANQYKQFGDPFNVGQMRMPTGRAWIYPVGTSLLQMPAYLVAHAGAGVANVFGARIPMHGGSYWHMRITFLSTLLAGWFSLLIGYRLARRYVSETAALYGVLVAGLGTGILFYGAYWVSYSHAWTALAVALLLESWDRTRGRHDARRWAVLGAYVGLAALTRLQEVTFAVIPAAEATIEMVRRVRAKDRAAALRLAGYCALATIAAVAVASPQLIANKIIMGSWFSVAPGAHYMRWDAPFLWEPLFSTRNGLFVWTPLAYLGVIGVLLAPRGPARVLAGALAVGFLLQIYVNGCAWSWWFDWSYSARRFVDSTVILLCGAAFVVERLRAFHQRYPRFAPHAAVVLALAPFLLFNLGLTHAVAIGTRKPGVEVQPAWKLYSESFSSFLQAMEDDVGNPLSWPHNLIWAARHGVSPGRYDLLVGGERLLLDHRSINVPGFRQQDAIKIDDNAIKLYGAGGFGPAVKPGGAWAATGARLLVPLFYADKVHIVLRGTSPDATAARDVELIVNGGAQTVSLAPGGPQDVRIDPKLHVGTNELVFRCAPPEDPTEGCFQLDTLTLVYEVPKP